MTTVLVDVDTQLDFVVPAGALYVPGAEVVLPNVARLNALAPSRGWKLISTADAHAQDDLEFRMWPAHCVAGTLGQRKPEATMLRGHKTIRNKTEVRIEADAPQLVVEKNVNDMFANPNLTVLLDELRAERYIVYGVVTEICVKCAVMGLLKRGGARVELVADAVRKLDDDAERAMMAEFNEAGGALTTTAEVCG